MTRPWAPVQTKTITRPAPAGPVSPFTRPPAPSPFTGTPVQVFTGPVSAFTAAPAAFTKPGGGRPPFKPRSPFGPGRRRAVKRRFNRQTIIIPQWRPGRGARDDRWVVDYFDIVDSEENGHCTAISPSGWIDLDWCARSAYEEAVDSWIEERMYNEEDEDMLEATDAERRQLYAESAEDVLPDFTPWYLTCIDHPDHGHLHPYPAHWVPADQLPLEHRQSDYLYRLGCHPLQAAMWLELLPAVLSAREWIMQDPLGFVEAMPGLHGISTLMDVLGVAGCELPAGFFNQARIVEEIVTPAIESGDETFIDALADICAGWHPERWSDLDPVFTLAAAAVETVRRHTDFAPGHPETYQFFSLPADTWPHTAATVPALGYVEVEEVVYHSGLADLDFQARFPGVLGWGEARCKPSERGRCDDEDD